MSETMPFQVSLGNLKTSYSHGALEIVQIHEISTWAIVRFEVSRDTLKWNARFVEDRPFDPRISWEELGWLIQMCYRALERGLAFPEPEEEPKEKKDTQTCQCLMDWMQEKVRQPRRGIQ